MPEGCWQQQNQQPKQKTWHQIDLERTLAYSKGAEAGRQSLAVSPWLGRSTLATGSFHCSAQAQEWLQKHRQDPLPGRRSTVASTEITNMESANNEHWLSMQSIFHSFNLDWIFRKRTDQENQGQVVLRPGPSPKVMPYFGAHVPEGHTANDVWVSRTTHQHHSAFAAVPFMWFSAPVQATVHFLTLSRRAGSEHFSVAMHRISVSVPIFQVNCISMLQAPSPIKTTEHNSPSYYTCHLLSYFFIELISISF